MHQCYYQDQKDLRIEQLERSLQDLKGMLEKFITTVNQKINSLEKGLQKKVDTSDKLEKSIQVNKYSTSYLFILLTLFVNLCLTCDRVYQQRWKASWH